MTENGEKENEPHHRDLQRSPGSGTIRPESKVRAEREPQPYTARAFPSERCARCQHTAGFITEDGFDFTLKDQNHKENERRENNKSVE